MPFETIVSGGASSSEPSSGSASPASGSPTPVGSAAAGSGVTSVADALKGAEHAKMNVFSVSDISKQPGAAGPAGSSVSLGGLVQGKIVVDLMDSLLPAILVLVFHRMGIETRKTAYQLTQGEKNTLAPIVEACLQTVALDFSSPWTTLTVSLLVIYGGKAAEVGGIAFLDKKVAEKTPAKPVAPPERLKPGKVVNMAPEPNKPPDSTNTDSFATALDVVGSDGPPVWTEADIQAVVRRRKCSREKAAQWLNLNWNKQNKGGKK